MDEFTPIFSRRYSIDRISPSGLEDRIEATESERVSIATLIGLESLDRFSFDFELRPIPARRYRLNGRLTANFTQICVVGLEPRNKALSDLLEVEFWPEQELVLSPAGDLVFATELDAEEPESIRNGIIDVGEFAYQHLALGADLYPRNPDATVDWNEEEDDAKRNPFAGLEGLKRQ